MFTGIVETRGRVVGLEPQRGRLRLTIAASRVSRGVKVGASVAVNGACLSAVSVRPPRLTFDVIAETLRRTNLGRLQIGSAVNLERPLRLGQRIDGHFVLGHVDGVGRIMARRAGTNGCWLDIEVGPMLALALVEKGSITIDGVSLTLGPCRGRRCRVFLIPQTLRATTLAQRLPGDLVNVETDLLMKLAARFAARRRR